MSDPQTQWARLLLSSLCEAGVKNAVISPGSRSTPLVWAATRTPGLSCHSLIDERSAGFYAVGQARVTGMPSVLICTSGSAVSHYYPAVIEARESGIPLLVLSADRPFELAHSGAHQTIDQTRLFGTFAAYHELGTPVSDARALSGVRRMAWQAVETALTPPRGAVHINFRAKKPLEPQGDGAVELREADVARVPPRRNRSRPPAPEELAWLTDVLVESECPLLVCGAAAIHDNPGAELVLRFAAECGAIVCPEAVSQLRFQLEPSASGTLICDTYEWLLDSPALAPHLRPDFVLQFGATPVSSALSRLLEQGSSGLRYAVCAESGWPDPLHQSGQILRCSARELLESATRLLSERRRRSPLPRVALWRRAQDVTRDTLRAAAADFTEPAAIALICSSVPRGSLLAVGNSLPPRLIDRYCPAGDRAVDVCSQRGASGIEGAIAGALGAASVAGRPTTLILGDISFLHDIGSLWAARGAHTLAGEVSLPVVIAVVNNAGGRIFDGLPIAAQCGVDLRFWTTPHTLDFRAAAEMYGVAYARAADRDELARALADAQTRAGVTLLEVVVAPNSAADAVARARAALEPQYMRLAASCP